MVDKTKLIIAGIYLLIVIIVVIMAIYIVGTFNNSSHVLQTYIPEIYPTKDYVPIIENNVNEMTQIPVQIETDNDIIGDIEQAILEEIFRIENGL